MENEAERKRQYEFDCDTFTGDVDSVENSTESAERPKSSRKKYADAATRENVILGFFFACIGATLGAVMWIVVYKLGYIAGVVGIATMYFAMRGYMMANRGEIGMKGMIISFVLTIVFLFLANYFSFAIQVDEKFGSIAGETFMESLKEVPDYLAVKENMKIFLTNLGFAYFMTIISAVGMFSKK